MALKDKGTLKISETTSLLNKDFLLEAKNFMPDVQGVVVRNGSTYKGTIATEEIDETNISFNVLAMKSVFISNEEIVLMVSTYGDIKLWFPEMFTGSTNNAPLDVYRKTFDSTEQLTLRTSQSLTTANIVQVGENIYVDSPQKTWVIKADGLLEFVKDGNITTQCIVNAEDATIKHLDYKAPRLTNTDKTSGLLPKDYELAVRARNEFGGRGMSSQSVVVPTTGSYMLSDLDGLNSTETYRHKEEYTIAGTEQGARIEEISRQYKTSRASNDEPNNRGKVLETVLTTGYAYSKTATTIALIVNSLEQFTVGQRVSCFTQTRVGSTFTDVHLNGTVSLIERQEDGDNLLNVVIDGGAPIDLDTTGFYSTIDVILWQTNDNKSYITHNKINTQNMRDNLNLAVANNLPLMVAQVNKTKTVLPMLPVYEGSTQTTPYTNAEYGSAYINTTGNVILFTDGAETPGIEGHVVDVFFPMQEEGGDNLGGTKIDVVDASTTVGTTWFKDKAYSVLILVVNDGTDIRPVRPVYITNEINNSIAIPQYISSMPKKDWGGNKQPNDTGLWCVPKNFATPSAMKTSVDVHGNPFIEKETIFEGEGHVECVYDYNTGESVFDYVHCQYEVLEISSADYDMKLAESTNDREICANVDNSLIFRNYLYFSGNTRTSPLMISKPEIQMSTIPKDYTDKLGEYVDMEYFNNSLWFACGNTIKKTNMLREWYPANGTFAVEGMINSLTALNSMLFVFTDAGVYTINTKGDISKILNEPAKKSVVAGDTMFFSTKGGQIYHTEFTPVPISNQWQQTNNPYVIKVEDTKQIADETDLWDIYDMVSDGTSLWVATNKGVWVFNSVEQTWWQQKFPQTIYNLVKWEDKILAVGGEMSNIIAIIVNPFEIVHGQE